jgi:small ligand-binding sensory domain FIST
VTIRVDLPATEFRSARSLSADWRSAARECAETLRGLSGANFGLLYLTEAHADRAGDILEFLKAQTGIAGWAGTVGFGVCADDRELFDRPALSAMVGRLPDDAVCLLPSLADAAGARRLDARTADWIGRARPLLGLVHGDPRNPQVPETVAALVDRSQAFLVGGLSSGRESLPQLAGEVTDGGLSGALFAGTLPVLTGLSQGCSPIGPKRTITAARRNVIAEIDGRPALEVFKEDIGELLARDLHRVAGYIFAGLPVAGSDTGDYLVRNLTGIDPANGLIAVGELIDPGREIVFTRRDRDAAVQDLDRMLNGVVRRFQGRTPKGAVYVSCLARGPNLFGDESEELRQVRAAIGDVPLVGFFANGEISHDRLYGYTGVLTVFL